MYVDYGTFSLPSVILPLCSLMFPSYHVCISLIISALPSYYACLYLSILESVFSMSSFDPAQESEHVNVEKKPTLQIRVSSKRNH